MLVQQVLSAVLAVTPSPATRAPPDFESLVDHAELVGDANEAQLIAYDSDGEVIGTIALWLEPDREIHLASDYRDGYAKTIVVDGRVQTESTLSGEVIATRASAVFSALDYVGPDADPQEGKLFCAFGVIASVYSCATASPVCPLTLGGTACQCLPLFGGEWERHGCP